MLLAGRKDEYSVEELHERTLERIQQGRERIHIDTDGSTDGNQEKGGGGVYVKTEDREQLKRLSLLGGGWCSSYGGECVAMLAAVRWIEERGVGDGLIITDSKSLTEMLKGKEWNNLSPTIRKIKESLAAGGGETRVIWMPSHIRIRGNYEADKLVALGEELPQEDVELEEEIVKAIIRREKWSVEHSRAKATYGDRRGPKEEERGWPMKVRTLYSKLRTGHCVELEEYRHRIGGEESALCQRCGEEEGDVEHILSRCVALERRRWETFGRRVVVGDMVEHPEKSRRLLEGVYPGLKL